MIVSLFLKWKFYENSFIVDISRYWICLLTIADDQLFYANMDHSLHRILGSFQIVLTSAKLFSVNYLHCLLCVVKRNLRYFTFFHKDFISKKNNYRFPLSSRKQMFPWPSKLIFNLCWSPQSTIVYNCKWNIFHYYNQQ